MRTDEHVNTRDLRGKRPKRPRGKGDYADKGYSVTGEPDAQIRGQALLEATGVCELTSAPTIEIRPGPECGARVLLEVGTEQLEASSVGEFLSALFAGI